MYILKDFQEKAVKNLLTHTFEALNNPQDQIPILLEAPTGSGKTVMMADYLFRMIDELPLQPGLNDNVAYIWFAPNTLHIQSFHSLKNLYADSAKLNCIDLSELSTDPVLNPGDLLFVNWSSVDSLKKIWRKENETNTNLETLVENTKANGTQIILIIDEAHLSAFTGPQAISVRRLIKAKIEISVTATPKSRPQRTVFISRQEVVEQEMIKKGVRLNIGLNPEEQNGENLHIHLLRKAFAKKKELEKYYNEELGENVINPLLIIQLPADTVTLSDEDNSIRDTLELLLANEFNITKQNGRLAVWLSGERDKDGLEEPNGLQDVLIFKQAIAQGWDCPRAAVLVSYRNVQSPDFGIQTVGRILRMPHQKHYGHDDLNYGYVYTNIESARINLVPSDSDYFNLQYAERKKDEGLVFDRITAFSIVNDRPSKGLLTSAFERIFFDVMEEKYGVAELPEIELGGSDAAELHEKIELNKTAMRQKNWQFEIDDHQIHIPADINVDPYEVNSIILNADQMQDFAITMAQFGEMFDRFCYDNITRLNRSKSWKKLREVLIHFAEYYLNVFEFEARRIFLFPYNKALLIQDISLALERFEAFQTAQGNESRRAIEEEWQVPELRYYNDLFNREVVEKSAMVPFFEYNRASTVEISFKEFLEQNESSIEWWYKNGDKGKEHFAIPYTNLQKELRLFYVDFVIKFTSGKIGLFDTKTKRSDLEAPNKHNALIRYIEEQNKLNTRRTLLGGIIIPEEINGIVSYRYCSNHISDTNDLTGWNYLNPVDLAGNIATTP
jgi:type III restriction enzyme